MTYNQVINELGVLADDIHPNDTYECAIDIASECVNAIRRMQTLDLPELRAFSEAMNLYAEKSPDDKHTAVSVVNKVLNRQNEVAECWSRKEEIVDDYKNNTTEV